MNGATKSAGKRAPTHHGHRVQFYEDDQYLTATVADFLGAGLKVGEPVVVIATEPHRNAFVSSLYAKGCDTKSATRAGRLTMLDARDTLSRFMRGRSPDPHAFRRVVGDVIETSRVRGAPNAVRAYGEMVDLLWKDGNPEGALELEELWNDLAHSSSFSLLCAYHMGNFNSSTHTDNFLRVCGQHHSVAPTESFATRTENARLLEVTLLQQRARALEAEIQLRTQLEARLRDALAAQDRALEAEQLARMEAEDANRAKSDFLAVMSHELRTPLNAIGGHVQLIQMGIYGAVNDPQRDALTRVERSQKHLLSLINDLLNLVRIEKGKVEYQAVRIELAPFLNQIASLVEPLVTSNQLDCSVWAPDGEEIVVSADPEKLHQIVLNLLTNSIKFTESGGSIRLEAGILNDPSNAAFIRVRDTGVGIPAEKLDTIFEPFVQLGIRPQSGQEGLGLGLAISRDLARGMGGDLEVTSETNAGTTFTLTLPRA